MNIEYHKWWSPNLNQDMELKVYGYFGKPVVVFPCQGGRFYEWEDFGMIEAIRWFVDEGKIKLFTVDSVDRQSWANWSAHPADRAWRHQDYDRYITSEVVPFIHDHCQGVQKMITTGCSMGGYHSANFFFRHPDIFDTVIAISGPFSLNMFVGDYMDDNIYYNSPLAYLSNMSDPWYLDQYRQSNIIVCVGQGAWEERMLADTYALKKTLEDKAVPAWIDIWGYDVNHDWPWWKKMLPFFLGHLNL
jgi:esterase/lipase superfamily enzyme